MFSAHLAKNAVTVLALASAPIGYGMAASSPTLIYSALGGTENGGDSFKSAGPILVDEIKVTTAGTLSSVVLNLSKSAATQGQFDVVLAKIGASGKPVLRTVIAVLSDAKLTSNFQLVGVQPRAAVKLSANTAYYVGIQKNRTTSSSVVLGNTLDPAVLSRTSVKAGGFYYNNGGVQANSGGPYEVAVREAP